MGKQHKDYRKMPLLLEGEKVGIDELIDALRYIKKDKDYNDIMILNVSKLEFFGDRLLTDEEYKEMLLERRG